MLKTTAPAEKYVFPAGGKWRPEGKNGRQLKIFSIFCFIVSAVKGLTM